MKKKSFFSKAILAVAGVAAMIVPFGEVEAAKSFKDVQSSHWAYASISQAADRGLVGGYEDGTFRPKGQVTRAEFATMLANVFEEGNTRQSESFVDVADNFWGKSAIEETLALGIIQPTDYKNNKFEPNKAMTRSEMSKWLANGLKASNSAYGDVVNKLQSSNLTLLPIAETYKSGVNKSDIGYIGLMLGTGLLTGYTDDTFKLAGNTSRAEVAAILTRYLSVMKKQPTDFKGLMELVEVAETGTNMVTATDYDYIKDTPDLTLKKIIGKPITYKNGIAIAKVKRMIMIDANNSSEVNSSIYGKMFVGKDAFYPNGNYVRVYVEREFTPKKNIPDIRVYLQGTTQGLLSGERISSESKIKAFGYDTILREEFQTYFKAGQTRAYWKETFEPKEVGYFDSIYTDDGSRMTIKYFK